MNQRECVCSKFNFFSFQLTNLKLSKEKEIEDLKGLVSLDDILQSNNIFFYLFIYIYFQIKTITDENDKLNKTVSIFIYLFYIKNITKFAMSKYILCFRD